LRNWPYVYGPVSTPGPGNKVAGKLVVLLGPRGPGPLVLGGAALAIGAVAEHQHTELGFIRFLTSLASERKVLGDGSLAPV
jgi:multiple sugar transport system substrate-binding protein